MSTLRKSEENSLTKERVSKIAPKLDKKIAPQRGLIDAAGGLSLERNYSRTLGWCIVDPTLSDGAFRFFSLLSMSTWKMGAIRLSFQEIGEAMGVRPRMAKYRIQELVRAGLIQVKRGHRQRNEYSILGGAAIREASASVPKEVAEPEACPSCTRGLAMTKRGICVACCRDANKVAAWMEAKGQLGSCALPVDIAARVLANKVVKTHKQAAKDAERIERYEAEWTA